MTDTRVLIIDDDRAMRSSLVDLIEAAGWTAKALARATEVPRWVAQFSPDVILSDVRMPDMSGLDLLRSLDDAPPVVLISAHGDIPTAVEAMNNGAYSFVEKPFDPKRLLLILRHASDQHRMRQSNDRLKTRLREVTGLDRHLLGQTPDMQRLRDMIALLADSEASVLITGETGTGKDLTARALHDLSGRGDRPFVAVNAAQINAEQLPHIAQSANGGTLFLDEICACPAPLQPTLLRLIDAGEVLAQGQGVPDQVTLRVVSATNEDTEQAVADGRLRADLLYRLSGFTLSLPPLRARLDDVPMLALRFLQDSAAAQDVPVPELTEADLTTLIAHDWPGNLRELRNVADRRVFLARQGGGTMADALASDATQAPTRPGLREAVAAFERQMIAKAIQAHAGRMDDAAEALGIGRRTLNEKIVKLGLDKDALL
ncbi:sigma-54-dependent transcriptional regulator [Pseudooctadecabacter jejudonensis]|uniref:C4-dicarboxylate transport transcriptional regulatory protein DctD n=1 Tax=Pseudooctadecabacter jejudonensis TaxID=1391910 RepID=A0A1Y5RWC3_9RHOB|nr:sigma-54 dependent transcriptional regulator [Pseudooctadecabacter jejudonensis]SLN27079.1 C4-dicarboxylate transport transcriptional regulatory protein DctD [Pseudooctadecabacter jejudonensis]